MIDHLGIVVSDLARSRRFYEACLVPLGLKVLEEAPGFFILGRGWDEPFLWVGTLRPGFWSEQHRPTASPIHLAFSAPDREAVRVFHAAGVAAGGTSNGAPGPRQASYPYYAAFVLDPDRNNIEAGVRG